MVEGAVRASSSGLAGLKEALEVLVDEFERRSQELPPDEDTLQSWRQRAMAIGKHLRLSDASGKNKLLLKLQKFQMQLRTTRAALQRYEGERDHLQPALNAHGAWPVALLGLQYSRHDPLAAAIRATYGSGGVSDSRLSNRLESRSPDAPPEIEAVQPAGLHKVGHVAEPSVEPVDKSSPEVAATTAKRMLSVREHPRVIPFPALAPARLAVRQDPIVAVLARLGRAGSFEEARAVAGSWLRKKGFKTPKDPAENFEIDGSGKGNRVIAVGSPGVWAMQADTVDPTVSGRRWRVEMVLIDAKPTPAVSVTLTSIAPADQVAPAPSVPVLVSQLIERVGMRDPESGEALTAEPIAVDGLEPLRRLLVSLQSPLRRTPAIVLSTYTKQDKPAHLLDPVGLSRRLRGIAKVYVLTRESSWGLTDALSRRFAVAGASVRLFRPGFTPEDDPSRHPQWGPDVLHAQGLDLNGLSELLERDAAAASLRALEQEDAIPPFDSVRAEVLRRQIDQARKQAAAVAPATEHETEQLRELRAALDNEAKLREMFEDDNAKQQLELQRLRAEVEHAAWDRDAWRSREYHLEARISELKQLLRNAHVDDTVAFPDNWDELETWCQQHLGDRVVVTPKAIRAARDSTFENVPFCYEVLLFLAETYVPCRRGVLDGGSGQLDEEKRRLGIDVSPVGQAAGMHRLQDTYSVMYKGRSVPLDMHVSGSSHRDPRKTFRVYFYWDANSQCVVVGWFPGHLENRLT